MASVPHTLGQSSECGMVQGHSTVQYAIWQPRLHSNGFKWLLAACLHQPELGSCCQGGWVVHLEDLVSHALQCRPALGLPHGVLELQELGQQPHAAHATWSSILFGVQAVCSSLASLGVEMNAAKVQSGQALVSRLGLTC